MSLFLSKKRKGGRDFCHPGAAIPCERNNYGLNLGTVGTRHEEPFKDFMNIHHIAMVRALEFDVGILTVVLALLAPLAMV